MNALTFVGGDIARHITSQALLVVCSSTTCVLTGQITVYYSESPMLSGAYPENLTLIERTNLPWQQAARRMKTMMAETHP